MSKIRLMFAGMTAITTVMSIPAHSDNREMSLKEMTEDSLRRTIELSDRVREADLRARDQLGSAEISQTPESAGQNASSHSTSNDNHK